MGRLLAGIVTPGCRDSTTLTAQSREFRGQRMIEASGRQLVRRRGSFRNPFTPKHFWKCPANDLLLTRFALFREALLKNIVQLEETARVFPQDFS